MSEWLSWTAQEWQAFGTVGTFIVALSAALAAFWQVDEARKLRREQSQPNVVVYFELSRGSTMHLDLVVRNLGQTVARDVRIDFTPELESTLDDSRTERGSAPFLKEGIPTLPPNMEYRMLFEDGPARFSRDDLPKRYRALVTFSAHYSKPKPEAYILDLSTFYGYDWITTYGEHDSAKALKDIANTAKRWTAHLNGIRIYSVDEVEMVRRREDEREERRLASKDEKEAASPTAAVESAESGWVLDLPPTEHTEDDAH